MADSKFVLRVKKLKNALSVISSAQHVYREKTSDNVISENTGNNDKMIDAGNSGNLHQLLKTRLSDENLKKDAKSTRLMEFVISASPEQLSSELFDQRKYFEDAVNWVKSLHGEKNVLSAVVHHDEDTPHLHVHVVPVNQIAATTRLRSVSKKGGGRVVKEFPVAAHEMLSANVIYGGPRKLSALQTSFEQAVGNKHGLHREQRYASGQEYAAEPHVSPRKYVQSLRDQEKVLAVKKKEIEALRAKLAQELDVEKLCTAELNLYRQEAKAKLVDLDQRLAGVVEDRAVVNDRMYVVQAHERDAEQKKMLLDNRKAEQTGFFSGIKVKLDQRESVVQEKEAGAIQQAVGLTEFGKSLDQREAGLDDREAGLDAYKTALTAESLWIKTDRVGYVREYLAKIDAAPTEEEKKKAASSLLTPVKKKSGGRH